MLTRAQIRSAPPKNVAAKAMATKGVAAKKATATSLAAKRPSTQNLWRHATWGLATAAALGVAVFSSQDDSAARKVSALLASLTGQPAPPPARQFDPESAARQLAQGVRTLADDRDRLAARMNTLEHDVRDMGGTTKQQIETAKAEAIKIAKQAPPWPESAPPVPMTMADVAVMVKTVSPAPSEAAETTPATASTAEPATAETTASVGQPYGADLGTGPTMKSLNHRWASLRAAHPQLFDGVQPVVSIKQNPRTGRTELHLVVGPYANAETASQFCDFVLPFRLNCQPTLFDGSHLAAQ